MSKERTLEEIRKEIDELEMKKELNELEIKYLGERLALIKKYELKLDEKKSP